MEAYSGKPFKEGKRTGSRSIVKNKTKKVTSVLEESLRLPPKNVSSVLEETLHLPPKNVSSVLEETLRLPPKNVLEDTLRLPPLANTSSKRVHTICMNNEQSCGIENPSSLLRQVCVHCRHLATDAVEDSLHSTLAYKKCRCHRRGGTKRAERVGGILSATGSTAARLVVLPPMESSASNPLQGLTDASRKGMGLGKDKLQSIECKQISCIRDDLHSVVMPIPFSEKITEILQLLNYIASAKRLQLQEKFVKLDRNEDGHLTFTEFLTAMPCQNFNQSVLGVLQQFYKMLSESTYFGQREFMLCYTVAEILLESRALLLSRVPQNEAVWHILKPFLFALSEHARGGRVSVENVQVAAACLNERASSHLHSISVSIDKWLLDVESLDMLKCFALGPFFLRIISRCEADMLHRSQLYAPSIPG